MSNQKNVRKTIIAVLGWDVKTKNGSEKGNLVKFELILINFNFLKSDQANNSKIKSSFNYWLFKNKLMNTSNKI